MRPIKPRKIRPICPEPELLAFGLGAASAILGGLAIVLLIML
ncbi:hypothetical protein [Zobellella denitrificans]|nr:hypothetical protein [Zobellella denitrificans]